MQTHAQTELPFASLEFRGRTSLYPHEIMGERGRLGGSLDQLYDLVTEGALIAIDLASPGAARRDLRVPIESYRNFVLARLTAPVDRAAFLKTLSRPALVQLRAEIDALIS